MDESEGGEYLARNDQIEADMRSILITLSFFILSGCSRGEVPRPVERNQPPSVAATATPPEVVEKNQTAHRVKGGGAFCEQHLLKKVAGEQAEGNQAVKLKTFDPDDATLSPDLKKWLENMDEEKLAVYELRHHDKRALLLGSTNLGATGIASNFQNWYLRSDNYSIKFLSLSANPKLVFWGKDGSLNYYSVEYGDEFLENRDWDNLTLDLLRHSINSQGEPRIVSEESDVKCQ